jgi:serine/threonine protein kinase
MAQTVSSSTKVNKTLVRGGTTLWKAPERLNTKISKLSNAVDVWAFGVLLLEVFCKTPIWDDMDEDMIKEQLRMGKGPLVDEDLSSEMEEYKGLFDIARACFLKDPANRPKMHQIVLALEEIAPASAKPSQIKQAEAQKKEREEKKQREKRETKEKQRKEAELREREARLEEREAKVRQAEEEAKVEEQKQQKQLQQQQQQFWCKFCHSQLRLVFLSRAKNVLVVVRYILA